METRELGAADRANATRLWAEAGLTREWNDAGADFDRAVSMPESAILGVFIAGDLIGTAMVGDDGHRGWVYYLAVDDAHRGEGAGRLLMAEAERRLRGRGVEKLNLMVRNSNTDALGFYERLGYVDDEVTVLSRRLDE